MLMNARSRASKKYSDAHFKRTHIAFQKTYYAEVLLPAVERSGETVAGFIKEAIRERIERMSACERL